MNSYYICKVRGKNFHRFIQMLYAHSIPIYQITDLGDCLLITLDEDGYQKVKKIRTSYEITLVGMKGKARYLAFLKKYRLLLASLVIGLFLLFFLSSFIWKIEVVHTSEEIRTLLLDALREEKVYPFRFKLSYQEKEQVKQTILEKYKDKIEWLEIEEVGTKYFIRVEERKIKSQDTKDTPRNIIAKSDAMILSITAEKGEILTKKFDYVKKGDVLISGVIHKEEEAKSKVQAEGQVFGEVWYTVSVLLPTSFEEVTQMGKPKRHLALHLFSSSFGLGTKDYQIRKQTPILKSSMLPFSLSYEEVIPIKTTLKHYNLITGEQRGISLATEKLKLKLQNSSEITYQKVLKKEQKGSKIYIEFFFKVKEDITAYQSIENLDLELENKKQEETG